MGLTPLPVFLQRHRRIALDTSVFICYLEANPSYVDLAGEVFEWLELSPNTAVCWSNHTAPRTSLVNQYYGPLSLFPHLEWVAPDLAIADTAARIRAHHRLRTPDALQVATAIRCGASALLTNDSDIVRVSEIAVEALDRLR